MFRRLVPQRVYCCELAHRRDRIVAGFASARAGFESALEFAPAAA